MNYLDKKSRVFAVICRLGVKYFHLPFGETEKWEKADKIMLEQAKELYKKLSTLTPKDQ